MLFWEDKVKTKLTVSALAAAALLSTSVSVQAQEVVEWWDFLGGGDGVRMKTLIDERTPVYESVAAVTVETDGRSVDEVAGELSAWLEGGTR